MARQLFRFFSSLKLAVFTILSLATVLSVATVLESYYGMRGAYVLVYGTLWFSGLLVLLGLNVLCAALSRYPWKKHQTGFLVTHAGILTLLLGSFLTQKFGVDGNLPVVEGGQDGEVVLSGLRLRILDEASGKQMELAVPESANAVSGEVLAVVIPDAGRLQVDRFIPRSVAEKKYEPSPVPEVGIPVLQLTLSNPRFKLEETLQAALPDRPTEINLGPAVIALKPVRSDRELADFLENRGGEKPDPKGYIVGNFAGQAFRFGVADLQARWKVIPGSSFEVKVERYLPYAVVRDNRLVSKSNEPTNPAVEIHVRGPAGEREKHTVFALFPEFSTLHKARVTETGSPTGLKFQMELPGSGGSGGRGRLEFAHRPGTTQLYYRTQGRDGKVSGKGQVTVAQATPTGWMDLSFEVSEWLPTGVEREVPREIQYISGGATDYYSAIRLNTGSEMFWLFEGTGKYFSLGGRRLVAQFTKERLSLPFQVFLSKFTIGTNPGTNRAASYSSRVKIKDTNATAGTEDVEHLISMNEPLTYGGYTFYQASYQMEEGKPPISVFSVNYDPGRLIKYLGSLLMVLGTCLMFYMNPHYWNVLLGQRKAKT